MRGKVKVCHWLVLSIKKYINQKHHNFFTIHLNRLLKTSFPIMFIMLSPQLGLRITTAGQRSTSFLEYDFYEISHWTTSTGLNIYANRTVNTHMLHKNTRTKTDKTHKMFVCIGQAKNVKSV